MSCAWTTTRGRVSASGAVASCCARRMSANSPDVHTRDSSRQSSEDGTASGGMADRESGVVPPRPIRLALPREKQDKSSQILKSCCRSCALAGLESDCQEIFVCKRVFIMTDDRYSYTSILPWWVHCYCQPLYIYICLSILT